MYDCSKSITLSDRVFIVIDVIHMTTIKCSGEGNGTHYHMSRIQSKIIWYAKNQEDVINYQGKGKSTDTKVKTQMLELSDIL